LDKEAIINPNYIDYKLEILKKSGYGTSPVLDTLKKYGSRCQTITEMGVDYTISTWAFMAARPLKLTSYDWEYNERIEEVKQVAEFNHIDFKFIQEDTTKCTIEPTDLLFIDTFHTYSQLKLEIELHEPKVGKFLIFHDTNIYGRHGQVAGEKYIPCPFEKTKGLADCIEEFLQKPPNHWALVEFNHDDFYGITVLKRVITGVNINDSIPNLESNLVKVENSNE